MTRELPGFYYDPEKNRYFPIISTIPRSLASSIPPSSNRCEVHDTFRWKGTRTMKLLQYREICGGGKMAIKGRCNFQEEYQKRLASQPIIWKYHSTKKLGDSFLEQVCASTDSCGGQSDFDFLLAGNRNGFLRCSLGCICGSWFLIQASVLPIGDIAESDQNVVKLYSDCVRHSATEDFNKSMTSPPDMWQAGGYLKMSSSISCIQPCRGHSSHMSCSHHVLEIFSVPILLCTNEEIIQAIPCIQLQKLTFYTLMHMGCDRASVSCGVTTMGSGESLAHVDFLNLIEPLNPWMDSLAMSRRLTRVGSFKFTIWTANYDFYHHQVTLGTNKGAALVDPENGLLTWVYRSRSDILSQQLGHSGYVILCGLRNGIIIAVDIRQKPYYSSELKRQSYLPAIASMPSSVCSLQSLELYDEYFLAGSMDGTIKLYDLRKTNTDAVQSYDGHVNSHTRLPLRVDPSERFLMAGGEDCAFRIWSLKSGELIFEDKFMDSAISSLCCKQYEGSDHGAWLGSRHGLFHLRWF